MPLFFFHNSKFLIKTFFLKKVDFCLDFWYKYPLIDFDVVFQVE
jgi:hypothetical protein